MFSSARVNDKVFDVVYGPGVIYEVRSGQLIVLFLKPRTYISFTPDGVPQGEPRTGLQTLYWAKPEIIAPPPPKHKMRKGGWTNIYPHNVYATRDDADRISYDDRLDCVYVEWEEEE